MCKDKHFNIHLGQRGVHRVIEKLIELGYCPCVPVFDVGFDLVTETGVRIQVKATLRPCPHWRYVPGTYIWQLEPGQRILRGQVVNRPPRDLARVCDIVVFWAADTNRFWVFPATALQGRTAVPISPRRQWVEFDVERARALRQQGMSFAAIAADLGVTSRTLQRRLDGSFGTPRRKFLRAWEYENRWDLIAALSGVVQEVNSVETPSPVAAS